MTEQEFRNILDEMLELGLLNPEMIRNKDYVLSQVEAYLDKKDFIRRQLEE